MTKDSLHLPSVAVLLSVIASLAFTVSAVWSFGYWRYFDINLLHHASLDALAFGLNASFLFLTALATTVLYFVYTVKFNILAKAYLFFLEIGKGADGNNENLSTTQSVAEEIEAIESEIELIEQELSSLPSEEYRESVKKLEDKNEENKKRLRTVKLSFKQSRYNSTEVEDFYKVLSTRVKIFLFVGFSITIAAILLSYYLGRTPHFLYFSFLFLALLTFVLDLRMYKFFDYRSPKLRLMIISLTLALGLSLVTFQAGGVFQASCHHQAV